MAGVYISYPFCAQKCTYCNFASGVFPRERERSYVEALVEEIGRCRWQWKPETVYLGGGTPSLIEQGDLSRILEAIPGRPWLEATLEAAPGTVTPERVRMWRSLGITRVSLGVQSFIEREIRWTGRKHTAQTVEQDVELLRREGIGEINLDLIAGLAGQNPDSWRESLDWIARLAPPHVSVYMLEVDEDSRLGLEILGHGSRYGAADTPSEEVTAELYETAVDRLAALGIARYEISNFAIPGHESRHNLKYWTLEPYAGFGADAHSFDGAMRSNNPVEVSEYLARPGCVEQTPANLDEERFFVGLRLLRGIHPSEEDWRRHQAAINRFLGDGLLETAPGGVLRLTRRGILLSNEVFQEFLSS